MVNEIENKTTGMVWTYQKNEEQMVHESSGMDTTITKKERKTKRKIKKQNERSNGRWTLRRDFFYFRQNRNSRNILWQTKLRKKQLVWSGHTKRMENIYTKKVLEWKPLEPRRKR